MSDDELQHARTLLFGLADMAGALARQAYEAAQADKASFNANVDAFIGLGRCLRLSLLTEMKLRQGFRLEAIQEPRVEALEALQEETPDHLNRLPSVRIDYDRESEGETESDGFPMTALGRAQALEAVIARHPGLDPQGRHSARIIDIKSRLQPQPAAPPDPKPPAPRPAPLNRAERRRQAHRLRRASG